MPQINITGKSGGGGGGDRDYGRRVGEHDSVRRESEKNTRETTRELRSVAEYLNRSLDDATKELRRAAEYFNRDFDLAAKKIRQEADYENANRDRNYKRERSLAEYENTNHNLAYRQDRSLAEYENTNHNLAYRQDRSLAEYENNNREKVFRTERQLAERENREFDMRLRKQQQIARDEQRASDDNFRKTRSLHDFNKNLANLQAYNANRPGFFGRAALGGARLLGGQRMRDATAQAFGIGSGGKIPPGGPLGGGGAEDELGAFGISTGIGAAIATTYEVVKTAITLPNKYASLLSSMTSAASAYTGPAIALANMGRGGGFSNEGMINQLIPPGMKGPPNWMRRRGITSADQATSMLQAYGGPLGSPGEEKALLKGAGDAFMSPYIGGMDPNVYMQSFGMLRQLGITNPKGGNTSGGGYISRDDFMRDMTKTVALGTSIGVDNAHVFNNISSLLNKSVSAGAPYVNAGAAQDTWWKYASSGAPSARTGEMQMNALDAQSRGVNMSGTGGGTAQGAAVYMYSMKKFGGKVPTDLKAFASAYNIDVSKLSSSQLNQLSDAHKNALNGNWVVAEDLLKSYLQGSGQDSTWREIASSTSGGMRPEMQGWQNARTAYPGAADPYGMYYSGQSGAQNRSAGPTAVARTPQLVEAYRYMTGTLGYSSTMASGILGGMAGVEASQFFGSSKPTAGMLANNTGGGMGAHGILQLRGPRLEQFMKQHNGLLPEQTPISTQLDFMNQEFGSTEAPAYAAMSAAAAAGKVGNVGALYESNYMRPGADPTLSQTASSNAKYIHNMFANDPSNIYDVFGNTGQAAGLAGKNAFDVLKAAPLDDLTKLSGGIVTVVDTFLNKTTEATKAMGDLGVGMGMLSQALMWSADPATAAYLMQHSHTPALGTAPPAQQVP